MIAHHIYTQIAHNHQVFQSAVIAAILDAIQQSPLLPSDDDSTTIDNLLRNLTALLELANQHLSISLDLSIKAIHTINILGYKNGTVIRGRMKVR